MNSVCIVISLIVILRASKVLALEYEVDENEPLDIRCSNSERIEIINAQFQYNRLNVLNLIRPNIRHITFFWGPYVGMCTWNVTKAVQGICNSASSCTFVPTREMFGDCGYKMFLQIDYECIPCINQMSRNDEHSQSVIANGIGSKICNSYYNAMPAIAKTSENCPNEQFHANHINTNIPNSKFQADTFASHIEFRTHMAMINTSSTLYNTVFITGGSPMTYHQENTNVCTFTRNAYKYFCKRIMLYVWDCEYKGQMIARHNMTNGHYLQQLDSDSSGSWISDFDN